MWNQFKRLLKHRFARDSRVVLSDAAMQRLAALVAQSEQRHTGQIRICIDSRLPPSYLKRSLPMGDIVRQRALSQFGKLRVWDTEHNNGILIYLMLPEHAIELVADRGIDQRVKPKVWQGIVKTLGVQFRLGQFEAGLQEAVAQVSDVLRAAFPRAAGQNQTNELPDRPVVDGHGTEQETAP